MPLAVDRPPLLPRLSVNLARQCQIGWCQGDGRGTLQSWSVAGPPKLSMDALLGGAKRLATFYGLVISAPRVKVERAGELLKRRLLSLGVERWVDDFKRQVLISGRLAGKASAF